MKCSENRVLGSILARFNIHFYYLRKKKSIKSINKTGNPFESCSAPQKVRP